MGLIIDRAPGMLRERLEPEIRSGHVVECFRRTGHTLTVASMVITEGRNSHPGMAKS